MKQPLPNEFLSAYLDGELTPDERVEVERALAENAEQRRLLEELQAVRGRLKGLPVREPSGELAERILRRAEEIARDRNGAARTGPSPVKASGRQAGGGGGGSSLPWRRLAVASAALAASLLVIVMLFHERMPELAVREAVPPSSPAPAESRLLWEREDGDDTNAESPRFSRMAETDGAFAPPASDSATGHMAGEDRFAADEFHAKGTSREGAARMDTAASKQVDSRGVAVVRQQAESVPRLQKKAPEEAEALGRDAKRAGGQNGGPRSMAPAPEAVARGGKQARRWGSDALPAGQAAGPSQTPAQAGASNSALGLEEQLVEDGPRRQQADALFRQIAADDVYVVPLEVEPVALQPANVNRVFLRNSIDVTPLSGPDSTVNFQSLTELAAPAAKPAAEGGSKSAGRQPVRDKLAGESEEAESREEVRARARQAVETIEQQLAGPTQTNLYYVEASPEQLQGLLRDFAQRPGLVRSFNDAAPLKNYHQWRFERSLTDAATPYFGGAGPAGPAANDGAPAAAGFGGGGSTRSAGGTPRGLTAGLAPDTATKDEPASASQPNVQAEPAEFSSPPIAGGASPRLSQAPRRGQALQIPANSLQARARRKVLSSVAELGDAAEKAQGESGARSQPESYRVLLILQADPNPPAPPLGDRQQVPRQHATEESNGGSQNPPSRRRPPRD